MALRNEVPCSCGTVTRGKQWAEVARPSWQLEEAAAAHRLQCGGAPELEATFRTTVEKCGEVARMELMQELVRVEAWILALLEAQQSIVWPSPSGEWWRDKDRAKARGEAELTSFGKATHLPSAARCGQSESKSELSFGFSLYRSDRWQLKLMSVSSRNKMLKHFQQSVIEAFGKPYVEGALVLNTTFCSGSILHNVWPSSMGRYAGIVFRSKITQMASLAWLLPTPSSQFLQFFSHLSSTSPRKPAYSFLLHIQTEQQQRKAFQWLQNKNSVYHGWVVIMAHNTTFNWILLEPALTSAACFQWSIPL